MKKFFTLIAFTCAFVPAIQGVAFVADINTKKIDCLTSLINNADVEAFKLAFDAQTSLEKRILGPVLEQSVIEAKVAIAKELEVLGDKNKNWSKVAKGVSATIGGSIIGLWLPAFICSIATDKTPEKVKNFADAGFNFTTLLKNNFNLNLTSPFWIGCVNGSAIGLIAPASFIFAHYGLTHGYKNIKVGLNYKQYLQAQLVNLNAVAAHIAHATAQANQEEREALSNVLEHWLVEREILDK